VQLLGKAVQCLFKARQIQHQIVKLGNGRKSRHRILETTESDFQVV
jgi:hypothetical protein